ncbi:hypothetical protein D6774_04810 [Candidatus Woesearchaeota archaeon]|jgi:hypothetical protein|nr:MAG: hypothetical protein D6774_04810 [Candidatus Woesearchaeota archaeon]
MADIKQQLIDLLVKLKILKNSDAQQAGNKQPGSSPKGDSSNTKNARTPLSQGSSGVTFSDAWNNFVSDLPYWGDKIKKFASWPQDRQIAFACLCVGVLLILVGIVVQVL